MTKKDYQAIARGINRLAQNQDNNGNVKLDAVVATLGAVMLNDNIRFDAVRFEEACFTGKCKGMKA